ncbi:MAG: WD40 repeat domain-containing serine/threonine protein kinase [Planctomycetota bacterium]
MEADQEINENREIDDILFGCLERPEAEWEQAVADACRRHQRLAPRLTERFAMLQSFGMTRHGPSPVAHLGDYQLLESIGGGSMGTVFLARRGSDPELVAIKILQAGLEFSPAARRRFEREREIAARLKHPGICAVRETGEVDGVPFLAMEYVEGTSLSEQIGKARADPAALRELLQVIESVARALHAAHSAGLVHRDVKPGNIIVRGNGQPVLLDFGLARELEQAGKRLTASGSLLGSPAYLAPETIDGPGPLDARSDIYSLGVTLFECLTGELPFVAPTREALFREILRNPVPDPRRQNPHVGRQLVSVLRVAMAKDPHHRYTSALAFADDLAAVRKGKPVSVHAPGLAATAAAWVRRNPLLAVFVLVLVVGLVSSAWLLHEVSTGLRRMRALGLANVAANTEPELGVLLGRKAVEMLEHPVTVSQLHAAVARYHHRVIYPRGEAAVNYCEFLRGGAGVVSRSRHGTARVCDLAGNVLAEIKDTLEVQPGPGSDQVLVRRQDGVWLWQAGQAELTPVVKGDTLAMGVVHGQSVVVSVDDDGVATLHRSDEQPPIGLPRADQRRWFGATITSVRHGSAVFLQDGQQILVADCIEGERGLSVPGQRLLDCAEMSFVVAAGTTKTWYRFDRHATRDPLKLTPVMQFGPKADLFRLSPGGELLAVREGNMTVRVFDARGEIVGMVPAHGVVVETFAFSPDGRLLATGDGDAVVRLYAPDGSAAGALHGHNGHVTSLAFSADGEHLVTGSYDRHLRVFRVRPATGHLLDGSRAPVVTVDAATNARVLWVDGRGELWLWSKGQMRRIATHITRAAAFVGPEESIFTCREDGKCVLLDDDGRERAAFASLAKGEQLLDISMPPQRDWLVGASRKERRSFLRLWQWRAGRWSHSEPIVTGTQQLSADVSAAGKMIASAGEEGVVHLYDVASGEHRSFEAHDDWIWSVRFSPAGKELLTTSRDNTARLWSLEGELLAEFVEHDRTIARGVFSPDGELIATASTDHTVHLRDRAGHLRAVLRGHTGQVWDVVFSRDGKYLISGAYDRCLRIWPVHTEQLLHLARELVDRPLTARERELFGEYLGR